MPPSHAGSAPATRISLQRRPISNLGDWLVVNQILPVTRRRRPEGRRTSSPSARRWSSRLRKPGGSSTGSTRAPGRTAESGSLLSVMLYSFARMSPVLGAWASTPPAGRPTWRRLTSGARKSSRADKPSMRPTHNDHDAARPTQQEYASKKRGLEADEREREPMHQNTRPRRRLDPPRRAGYRPTSPCSLRPAPTPVQASRCQCPPRSIAPVDLSRLPWSVPLDRPHHPTPRKTAGPAGSPRVSAPTQRRSRPRDTAPPSDAVQLPPGRSVEALPPARPLAPPAKIRAIRPRWWANFAHFRLLAHPNRKPRYRNTAPYETCNLTNVGGL